METTITTQLLELFDAQAKMIRYLLLTLEEQPTFKVSTTAPQGGVIDLRLEECIKQEPQSGLIYAKKIVEQCWANARANDYDYAHALHGNPYEDILKQINKHLGL
jgi:hypothetical protein